MTSGAMYCKVPMNLLAWSGDDGFPPPVAVFWHALNVLLKILVAYIHMTIDF